MTPTKEKSRESLLGALKESKRQRESQEAQEDRSSLRALTLEALSKDQSPERVSLLHQLQEGAVLTGPEGIRKRLGAFDLAYFGRAYLSHYFSRPSPAFHGQLDEIWFSGVMKGRIPDLGPGSRAISREPGCRRAVAAPRGHAKSTNLTMKDTLHAVLYQYKHYPILLSDSTEQAEGFLEALREELEENQAIREDFGELAGDVWRSGVLVTRTGIKVEAIGSGKKIRGRKHKNWRPDLILLDDAENDENVATPEQRRKLENWFYKAVSKAGDSYTDILLIGTLLHYDSLLAKVMRNPGYQVKKYQAVLQFSDSPLWTQWEELYTSLDNPSHEKDALDFYLKHREAMLEGTQVLWEEKLSYYQLMALRVSEGEASFFSELQNEPVNPEDCLFQEDWLDFYNPFQVDFSAPEFQFFGAADPSLGKSRKSDYSAIVTLALDTATGYLYVADADIQRRHPDQIIQDIFSKADWLMKSFGKRYVRFGVETVQFQWFLKEAIAREAARRRVYLPLEELPQTTDKTLRISALQPDVKNKYIKFNPRHKLLLEQLKYFPMAAHDDGPDALEMARSLCVRKKGRVLVGKRRGLGF